MTPTTLLGDADGRGDFIPPRPRCKTGDWIQNGHIALHSMPVRVESKPRSCDPVETFESHHAQPHFIGSIAESIMSGRGRPDVDACECRRGFRGHAGQFSAGADEAACRPGRAPGATDHARVDDLCRGEVAGA